jgi:hypothetical protein
MEVNGALQKILLRQYVERAKLKREKEKKGKHSIDSSSYSDQRKLNDKNMNNPSNSVCSSEEEALEPIPDSVLSREPLLLNIGGIKKQDGWVIVNSQKTSIYTSIGLKNIISL